MPSPIERLVDASGMRCTKCEAPAGTCVCWERCSCGWTAERGKPCRNPTTVRCSTKVKYGDQVLQLECPSCETARTVERHASDPRTARRVVFPCAKCLPRIGDAEVLYYDASGRQITAF